MAHVLHSLSKCRTFMVDREDVVGVRVLCNRWHNFIQIDDVSRAVLCIGVGLEVLRDLIGIHLLLLLCTLTRGKITWLVTAVLLQLVYPHCFHTLTYTHCA